MNWFEELRDKGAFDGIADWMCAQEPVIEENFRRVDAAIDRLDRNGCAVADKIDAAFGIGDHTGADIAERLTTILTTEHPPQKTSTESGDIIGVQCIGFEHYGIYVGDGRVIHYTSLTGSLDDIAIRETSMSQFLGDSDSYFIFDCETGPDFLASLVIYNPEETVQRARKRLGEDKYNLLFNNCEHFAIWCKTGISKSYQIDLVIGKWGRTRVEV